MSTAPPQRHWLRNADVNESPETVTMVPRPPSRSPATPTARAAPGRTRCPAAATPSSDTCPRRSCLGIDVGEAGGADGHAVVVVLLAVERDLERRRPRHGARALRRRAQQHPSVQLDHSVRHVVAKAAARRPHPKLEASAVDDDLRAALDRPGVGLEQRHRRHRVVRVRHPAAKGERVAAVHQVDDELHLARRRRRRRAARTYGTGPAASQAASVDRAPKRHVTDVARPIGGDTTLTLT